MFLIQVVGLPVDSTEEKRTAYLRDICTAARRVVEANLPEVESRDCAYESRKADGRLPDGFSAGQFKCVISVALDTCDEVLTLDAIAQKIITEHLKYFVNLSVKCVVVNFDGKAVGHAESP